MKRIVSFFFILILALPLSAQAEGCLVPVGQLVGLNLWDNTVTVAAFDDVLGGNARDAGLRIGDQIEAINGTPIQEAEQIRPLLENSTGPLEVQILRGSKRCLLHLEPVTQDGSRVMGVYLRQGISGIGTVTWYDPATGRFAALGHGVSTPKEGLLKMVSGDIFPAKVSAVQKGKVGTPGLLRGQASSEQPMGTLSQNLPQGIFGTTAQGFRGSPVPVGQWETLHTGSATIRATVQGDTPRDYSVEILKLYPKDRTTHRNFLLKVTDPELLQLTGGIVQGMSGSPIIQDGKLVGAVTHV